MFSFRKQQAISSRDSLAREVAERSVAPTLERLSAVSDKMSVAELRGYVRAHALAHVQEEATQLLSREWPKDAFNELVLTALDQATHLIVARLKSSPVVAMPSAHVRLRAA